MSQHVSPYQVEKLPGCGHCHWKGGNYLKAQFSWAVQGRLAGETGRTRFRFPSGSGLQCVTSNFLNVGPSNDDSSRHSVKV